MRPSDSHDTFVVCNKSTTHPDAPVNQNGVLRVDLTVSFVCDTIIDPAKRSLPLDQVTRDDISCKITYCSVINPGGWAPASVLRTVYKREYPRFLKRFTQYVIDKTKGKPILWT
jgi:collagen type IV alpha-3-binding protein